MDQSKYDLVKEVFNKLSAQNAQALVPVAKPIVQSSLNFNFNQNAQVQQK